MIDITPLDVRKKKGDFTRSIRGYDPDVVDAFLDLVADRLEELVRDNATLKERAANLTESLAAFRDREQALNEALVSAQQLREDMKVQAARDSEMLVREARGRAEQIIGDAEREAAAVLDGLTRLEGQRSRFLRNFKSFLQRQLQEVETEEERDAEAEPMKARAVQGDD